jgi:ComF family protein
MDLIKITINKIINFIFPPCCYSCGENISAKGLCVDCFTKLEFACSSCESCGIKLAEVYKGQRCLNCINNGSICDGFFHVFNYNEQIFELIKKYKYYDNTNLAELLGGYLELELKNILAKHSIDVIIPIPIHFFKLIKRKFNHMAFLAKYLSKKYKIPYDLFSLKKIKHTKDQMKLKAEMRSKNVKQVFKINPKNLHKVKDKHILLIDDVVTTGNTVAECIKVLKKAGAKSVVVLAIARVDGIINTFKTRG